MLQLNLYSTSQCHLCENAESLLMTLSEQHDINWQVIEISDNESLLELYEVKIPVIKRMDNNCEIHWPFSKEELAMFFKV